MVVEGDCIYITKTKRRTIDTTVCMVPVVFVAESLVCFRLKFVVLSFGLLLCRGSTTWSGCYTAYFFCIYVRVQPVNPTVNASPTATMAICLAGCGGMQDGMGGAEIDRRRGGRFVGAPVRGYGLLTVSPGAPGTAQGRKGE